MSIKKFKVDPGKCNACGVCVLLTDLLVENAEGKAVPVAGGFIKKEYEAKAANVVAQCPVNAISIIEDTASGTSVKTSDFAKELEDKFAKFNFPEVTLNDIRFNAKSYSMDSPGSSGHNRYEYSSDSRAEKAGLEAFNSLYLSQYRKYILSVFIQYKNDKLKPYYTFERSNNSYYYTVNKQIEDILKEIETKVKIASDNRICLPNDFAVFNVYPGDENHFVEERLTAYLGGFENQSTQSGIMAEMDSRGYKDLDWYSTYIDTDDREETTYGGGGLFSRDKTVTKYCYCNLRKAGSEFFDNLQICMDYVDIDENAIDVVKNGVKRHHENAVKKMREKADTLKKAIAAL